MPTMMFVTILIFVLFKTNVVCSRQEVLDIVLLKSVNSFTLCYCTKCSALQFSRLFHVIGGFQYCCLQSVEAALNVH